MASGYVRQSAGTIVTGNTIQASDFNNEFNALLAAFDASAGHTHDGTVGGGAKIAASGLNGLTTLTTGMIAQTASATFAAWTLTGTTNRVTITNGNGVAGAPTFDISAAYVGQTSITTVGTIATGTWSGLFGAVTGANLTNLTAANIAAGTAGISVTGNAGTATALQTARTINGTSFNGTANITVTADASTLTNTTLNATVVSSSLTSVGTIATGTWQGTVIGPAFGGTGIANNAAATTTRSGNFALTQTLTGITNVTYPTTGTLATTGNLSQFAATTSAQLAGVISDETGTGALVFGTAPTIAQANLVGVTTNSSAAAGSVGEYVFSQIVVASAVSVTTGISADVTSISLTAGDWDVWGIVTTAPAGSTTTSIIVGWTSTTSATLPTIPNNGGYAQTGYSSAAGLVNAIPVGLQRISLASTTTVFLSTNITFGVSTMKAYGFIGARRQR